MKRRVNNNFMVEATFKQYLWCDNTHYIDYFNGTVTLRIRMTGNGKYFAQEVERGPKHYDITMRMTSRLILHMAEDLMRRGLWDEITRKAWDVDTTDTKLATITPFTGAA